MKVRTKVAISKTYFRLHYDPKLKLFYIWQKVTILSSILISLVKVLRGSLITNV